MRYIIILIFSFLFTSCKNHDNHLFYIDNWNDLAYMVNSTNVKEIKTYENIFISDLEKSFENYYTYKNFGKIYENEYFSTYIILVQMDNPELHYSFSITTVNKSETKMIDSFYLSGYSHDSGELCTGYISKDLLIFKTCDSDNFKINKRINTFGKIVDIN